MTACCQALNITISNNDIKESHGFLEGSYTFNGFISEMDYWVNSPGESALWYMSSGSYYFWLLGPICNIGTLTSNIIGVSTELEKNCPINDDGNIWNWNYWSSDNWNPTNDLSIKCLNPNPAGLTISKAEQQLQKKMKQGYVNPNNWKYHINPNSWKYSRLNEHHDKSGRKLAKTDLELLRRMNFLTTIKSSQQQPRIDYEKFSSNNYHSMKYFSHHTKKSSIKKTSKYSYSLLKKEVSTKLQDQNELRHSYKATSKYGLTVILNPNEPEYTDALKNNYIGFKTLVHTPYNFPEVDAVGMAMDKNVQATVGIRGHH